MMDTVTQFAANQQRRFDATTLPRARRERGHFGTAPAIADFMARMFTRIPQGPVRILDPGAGVGTLSAGICQRVLAQQNQRHLIFELIENDPQLIPLLEKTMTFCKKALRDAGHEMNFVIRVEDFVLSNTQASLLEAASEAAFDLAILNPPYFKMRKESAHARAMNHVVHGQPNMYAFFMAVVADLLREGGEMVAITPRSYFNGPYFKRFRKWFFDRMTVRQIHLFESRTDAFQEEEVLQENVILLAEKAGAPKEVLITSSAGRILQHVDRHSLSYAKVIEDSTGDHLVRVATSGFEQEIVQALDRLHHRFRELPFKVSTGPVVTFRSTQFLRRIRSNNTAPLLWMHNVRPFVTRFPAKNGKPTHIIVSPDSQKLLLAAKRYVLLKRFTAKEERRRLVAGIVEAKDSYSSLLGLENHLNYVYRPDGELSKSEALGLAALFNSALVDRYFRAISGNTQVNAAEIRAMPFPSLKAIREIGEALDRAEHKCPTTLERIVGHTIGLPEKLIEKLCEAFK
jgi:adenine-specific DNA-methyltransferase